MPYEIYLFPPPPNPKDIILRPIPPIIIKHHTIEETSHLYDTIYTTKTLPITETEHITDTIKTHKTIKTLETHIIYDKIYTYKNITEHDISTTTDVTLKHATLTTTDRLTLAYDTLYVPKIILTTEKGHIADTIQTFKHIKIQEPHIIYDLSLIHI